MRLGTKEYRQFVGIARGSAGEVCDQLLLAKDLRYISDEVYGELRTGYDPVGDANEFLNRRPPEKLRVSWLARSRAADLSIASRCNLTFSSAARRSGSRTCLPQYESSII